MIRRICIVRLLVGSFVWCAEQPASMLHDIYSVVRRLVPRNNVKIITYPERLLKVLDDHTPFPKPINGIVLEYACQRDYEGEEQARELQRILRTGNRLRLLAKSTLLGSAISCGCAVYNLITRSLNDSECGIIEGYPSSTLPCAVLLGPLTVSSIYYWSNTNLDSCDKKECNAYAFVLYTTLSYVSAYLMVSICDPTEKNENFNNMSSLLGGTFGACCSLGALSILRKTRQKLQFLEMRKSLRGELFYAMPTSFPHEPNG